MEIVYYDFICYYIKDMENFKINMETCEKGTVDDSPVSKGSVDTEHSASDILSNPWTKEAEDFLRNVITNAREKNEFHRTSAHRNCQFDMAVRIPTLLATTTSGFILSAYGSNINERTTLGLAIALIGASFFSTLSSVFQFQVQAGKHNMSQCKYESLESKILLELSKKIRFRRNAEAFLAEIRLELVSLGDISPSEMISIS